MNDTSQAAYLIAQAAAAMIEAMGMMAENQRWGVQNERPTYTNHDFFHLIDKYGLGHNDAMTTLRGE
jgi:hypothetical protein